MTYQFEDDTYPLEAISKRVTGPLPTCMQKRKFPWFWFVMLWLLILLLGMALALGWIRIG